MKQPKGKLLESFLEDNNIEDTREKIRLGSSIKVYLEDKSKNLYNLVDVVAVSFEKENTKSGKLIYVINDVDQLNAINHKGSNIIIVKCNNEKPISYLKIYGLNIKNTDTSISVDDGCINKEASFSYTKLTEWTSLQELLPPVLVSKDEAKNIKR